MSEEPKLFPVSLVWTGERTGDLSVENKVTIKTGSPIDSPVSGHSPEDLFVASATVCYMNGFVNFCKKIRIEFKSFECDSVGTLEKVGRSFEITKIEMKAKVVIESEDLRKKIDRALELAAKYCFVGNSMKCPIIHSPEVIVGQNLSHPNAFPEEYLMWDSVIVMTDDSHEYLVKMDWTHGRVGDLTVEGKPKIQVAAPPEFDGPEGVISPEDLFVAAATSCFMTTFVTFTKKMRIEFKSFSCYGYGTLERVEKGFQFTKLLLKAKVGVESEDLIPKAGRAMELAGKYCLVSNSMKCTTEHENEVVVE